MGLKSGGDADQRWHMCWLCCGSASAGDRRPERDGGICGLPLQFGRVANDVAVVLEVIRVRELVPLRWHIGSARVDCFDPSKKTWHLSNQLVHCISAAVCIPRAQLLPVAKR